MNLCRKTVLSFIIAACILGTFAGCNQSSQETNTDTTSPGSTQPNTSQVEVDYFYESGACFCLGLASEWVNAVMSTDYQSYINDGKLLYKTYDTTDPANGSVKEAFNATAYGFFITTFPNGERHVKEVKSLWFYLDSSGTNEMLKSKFIGVLTKELDAALGIQ